MESMNFAGFPPAALHAGCLDTTMNEMTQVGKRPTHVDICTCVSFCTQMFKADLESVQIITNSTDLADSRDKKLPDLN